MRIPLNRDLVRSLITFRFGSVPEFVDAWQERMDAGRQANGKATSLKTVCRWLNEGSMPSDALFGLAGTLDVDPISVLDLRSDRFAELFAKERTLDVSTGPAPHRSLPTLRQMYVTVACSAKQGMWLAAKLIRTKAEAKIGEGRLD